MNLVLRWISILVGGFSGFGTAATVVIGVRISRTMLFLRGRDVVLRWVVRMVLSSRTFIREDRC